LESPPEVAAPVASTTSAANVTSVTSTSSVAPPPSVSVSSSAAPAEIDPFVLALAKDCRWQPLETAPDAQAHSCMIPWDQSCVPDYCFEKNQDECRPVCKKTCDGCADGCASTCETCKSKCSDDACKLECAKGCATCRDACVSALDRCFSGDCNAKMAACYKDLDAEWEKSPCSKRCDQYKKCVDACYGAPAGPMAPPMCGDKCWSTVMKGCSTKFAGRCGWG